MMININELPKKLGKQIKIERIKQDIAQEKLAELADLHRTTLGFIENGKTSPTLDSIEKIANAFNITLSELFKNIEEQ